ncbi:MAG: hypothetical protein IJ183_05920 [Prevotella sp.]|nr:hypothetical protein [Prevotella sp.]
MKILHYIPSFSQSAGPLAQSILRFVTAVSPHTDSCLVTSTPLSKELEQRLAADYSLRIMYLPDLSVKGPFKLHSAVSEMKKCLELLQPDLVHIHGSWNPLLYLMERTARSGGYVTCVSTYGGMSSEVLNTDFFKTKFLPLVFCQAPMIRHCTSLIAINEKEWNDIRNLNLKKRVEIMPEPGAAGTSLTASLLAAYQKAIDSSYRRFITLDEEMLVERCLITATKNRDDMLSQSAEATKTDRQSLSFRRIFFYAYDEDVLDQFLQGARQRSYNMPSLEQVADIPRYVDRKAKKRGTIHQLPLPLRKTHIKDADSLEYRAVTAIMRAHKEGFKRLTLRHKAELYDIFRNDDFDEGVVAAELKRLGLRRFTRKLQSMLHDMYSMPVGYDIF